MDTPKTTWVNKFPNSYHIFPTEQESTTPIYDQNFCSCQEPKDYHEANTWRKQIQLQKMLNSCSE